MCSWVFHVIDLTFKTIDLTFDTIEWTVIVGETLFLWL